MTEAVTLALATYRRPEELSLTLDALVDVALAAAPDVVEVLVVDNDPAGGARAEVSGRQSGSGVPVHYVHEPRPGIAAARNRALDAATTPLLVFVDDDEHPRPGWLPALLAERVRSGAAVVSGPVVSEFAVEPDRWITAGRFFQRQHWPTGTVRDVAATNNLLLDLAEVARVGVRFDDRFGLVGGSDTLFTRQLTAAGLAIAWCDEAVVVDRTPVARTTRAWVLRRAYRNGNSGVLIELSLAGGPAQRAGVRVRAAARGSVRVVAGTARAWFGVVTGNVVHDARGRRVAARGRGMLGAAAGRVWVEYRRPS